jgi:hypothetical protein
MAVHHPAASAASAHPGGSVSIPLTIAAAVLSGLGLWLIAYWLITFHWIYFVGVPILAVGAYLLFTRVTGPDRA